MAIYEGSTGIQSLDLLGRKVPMKDGQALQILTQQMNATIELAKKEKDLVSYSHVLSDKIKEVQSALEYLMPYAMKGDYENYLADATIFMELLANVVIGHQWLKIAISANEQLNNESRDFEADFYHSKIQTMKFYFKYELPKTKACLETLLHDDKLTLVDDEKELIF
jgi:butyryl-CoA dehydrogenase